MQSLKTISMKEANTSTSKWISTFVYNEKILFFFSDYFMHENWTKEELYKTLSSCENLKFSLSVVCVCVLMRALRISCYLLCLCMSVCVYSIHCIRNVCSAHVQTHQLNANWIISKQSPSLPQFYWSHWISAQSPVVCRFKLPMTKPPKFFKAYVCSASEGDYVYDSVRAQRTRAHTYFCWI